LFDETFNETDVAHLLVNFSERTRGLGEWSALFDDIFKEKRLKTHP